MAHDNDAHLVTYVTRDEQKTLRLLAAEKGVSISGYVRDLVRDHLKKIAEQEQK